MLIQFVPLRILNRKTHLFELFCFRVVYILSKSALILRLGEVVNLLFLYNTFFLLILVLFIKYAKINPKLIDIIVDIDVTINELDKDS